MYLSTPIQYLLLGLLHCVCLVFHIRQLEVVIVYKVLENYFPRHGVIKLKTDTLAYACYQVRLKILKGQVDKTPNAEEI